MKSSRKTTFLVICIIHTEEGLILVWLNIAFTQIASAG